ncbi:MAG: homoserine dehydrogenase [bacterium]
MNPKEIVIGLFGFGTIGAGVLDTLTRNGEVISGKTGTKLTIKNIVDIDTTRDRGVKLGATKLGSDKNAILEDDSVSIVIELIGGVGAARDIVTEALRKKKSVVTANKELIARHGPELEALARANGVRLMFEAAVGGGIPIITPLLACLRANKINRVTGIVNGTTNFILTQMETEGASFGDVLKEAQARGYAEADPTNDVEGFDAAYKATILASVAFGKYVDVASIYREGITKISREEMNFAKELGYTIKLLAALENREEGADVRVHPALLPKTHPLASVNGVLNAVYIEGDPIGPLMFVGEGAGPNATSSAVVGDVIAIATGCFDIEDPPITFVKSDLIPIENVDNAFYLRMRVEDRPGVLADISRCLGDCQVSIASLVQHLAQDGSAEIVWLTHVTNEGNMKEALENIRKLDCVDDILSVIRVYE